MTTIHIRPLTRSGPCTASMTCLYGTVPLPAPPTGRAPLRSCADIQVEHSFFDLRYPFWHDHDLTIRDCELTDKCRAALWYSDHITIEDTKLHGIKALRECADAVVRNCDILSPEFGWNSRRVTMEDCTAVSEYFMMRGFRFTVPQRHLPG